MNKINNLIAPAIAYIHTTKGKGKNFNFFDSKQQDKIPKEYKGYISSFGTAVLQSGLKVAVALFSDKSEGGEQSKMPIVNAVWHLVLTEEQKTEYNSLMAFVIDHHHNGVRTKVLDAIVALKLALRTFEIAKETKA